jgi:site-specific recombinase XerD
MFARELLGKNAIVRRVKRWIRKAGLPEELHTHSLRHTAASWLVQSGTSIYAVQQILGHSTIRMTEVYSHLQPEHLRKEMEKLTVGLN